MANEYIYKYIPASKAAGEKEVKNQYIELFQQTLTEQFYNSSDWWCIQEETEIGSQEYEEIDVHINHVINAETGLKLGDDWKTVLFKDINHDIELGKQYVFNNNTWLTINTEIIKNLTGTCTIRRCNNALRWIDEETGAYYEEPCCIEYLVKEPRDYMTSGSPFITPGGFLHIEMQFNERSNKIKESQRFLFGNSNHWTCYKVVGTGINDFRNAETYDNNSARILTLDLIANFVNLELDDVANGIADAYTNVYTITLNRTTVEGAVSGAIQLSASITYNGKSVTRDIIWETSNIGIATVDTNGLVTFRGNGTCTITANIENNSVSDSCTIIVKSNPATNTDIVISPDINFILEGTHRDYSVYLYENNTIQADTFVITCDVNDVPYECYGFSQTDDNHFTVWNKLRSSTSYLTITCTSGAEERTFDIYLRGAW